MIRGIDSQNAGRLAPVLQLTLLQTGINRFYFIF